MSAPLGSTKWHYRQIIVCKQSHVTETQHPVSPSFRSRKFQELEMLYGFQFPHHHEINTITFQKGLPLTDPVRGKPGVPLGLCPCSFV